jgi:hypothetical protein
MTPGSGGLVVEHHRKTTIKRKVDKNGHHQKDKCDIVGGYAGLAVIYYKNYPARAVRDSKYADRQGLNFGGEPKDIDGVRVWTGCNRKKR